MKISKFLSMLAVMAMASFAFVSCDKDDDENEKDSISVNKNWRYEYTDAYGKYFITELADNGSSLSFSEQYPYDEGSDDWVITTEVFDYDANGTIVNIDEIVEFSSEKLAKEEYKELKSLGTEYCLSHSISGNIITCKGVVDDFYDDIRTKQDVVYYYEDILRWDFDIR